MNYLLSIYLLSLLHLSFTLNNNALNEPHTIVVVESIEIGKLVTLNINKSIEYILSYTHNETFQTNIPVRASVSSDNVEKFEPIIIISREQKSVISWQIPLLIETKNEVLEFKNTSRTFCMDVNNPVPINNESFSYISAISPSVKNVSFSILVDYVQDFYVKDTTDYTINLSPSQPKYYFYKFDQKTSSMYNYQTVLLEVTSSDDVCMMISIQNASCPVYDMEREIQFEGYWETMTTKGGITLTQSKFPQGFYVVFVVKGDDSLCSGLEKTNSSRNKEITFRVTPSISYTDYVNATLLTLALLIFFYVIFWVLLCVFAYRYNRPMTMDVIDESDTATVSTVNVADVTCPIDDDSSLEDYDTVSDVNLERDIYLSKPILCVADLARKNLVKLKIKSNLYLWNVLTVAVFYGMPVIQLVIQYQKVLNNSGNQDLCYYNFLCAHPLGFLSDFNHVFSNIGYVALGILFVLLVYRRERMHIDHEFDKRFGIPQHYGLFYAMGVALIMEGVLSGSYHVCPNHYNFQFDSSFMYVMAVLCMVKIYQTRHPDINAHAHTTFGILAGAIFLGMFGIFNGTVSFWIFFTVLHICTCLLLTVQIYFLGRWKLDLGIFKRIFIICVHDFRSGPLNMFIPTYKGRFCLLLLGNACNWAIAFYGLTHHDRDFATYLLVILMGNTVLYTTFYIIMKLIHGEKIQLHSAIFIILGFVTWFSSLYFFINKSISWALLPAESRRYNKHCVLLRFYDNHDVWHFLSAMAMFFSFLMLLTIDDDLAYTHRSKIAVF